MRNRGQSFVTTIGFVLGVLLGPATTTLPRAAESDEKTPKDLQAEAEANTRPQTEMPGVTAQKRDENPQTPLIPLIVLHDQTTSVNANATSQNFEAANDANDNQGADDFFAGGGGIWNVNTVVAPGVYSATHGTPASMRVAFYQDAAGVPGALICDFPALTFVEAPVGTFTMTLPGGCLLGGGVKWVSVVANLTFGGGGGQWFWSTRTVLSGNPSKWQNPGGGFGTPCTTWGTRTSCLAGQTDPDFAFRLDGDVVNCQTDSDCDDGNYCNGYETCVAGTCNPGMTINCSDNLFCTIESCDPATGICSSTPNPCVDDNPCTVGSCDEDTDTCSYFSPAPIYRCNPMSIVIPGTGTAAGVAAPYPSSITISGLPAQASVCAVELLGMNHTWEGDVDIMLVSPLGGSSNRTILSDVGGSGDFINTNLALTDGAASSLPASGNIASGSYKPTNSGAVDTFDAPAPPPTGLASLSGFDGINPNGTWSLFVRDDANGDVGNISGGWCVSLVIPSCSDHAQCSDGNLCNGVETCNGGSCTPGTPPNCDDHLFCTIDSCDPATGACNHAPDPCNDGNRCTTDSCAEGAGCVNSNACVSFCTPDPIALNDSAGGTPPTAATPYPSTISVTGLPSPASIAQVRLLDLSHTFPDDLDMLLVGPAGPSVNATIMSDVGGSADVVSIRLALSDTAAASIPDGGPLATGTFKPTNVDTSTDAFPAPAPAASGMSPLSTFGTGNQNGTWSLYISDDANTDSGTLAGGWCLDMIPGGCNVHGDCEDGNPCTTDLCNAGACAHNPNNVACEDGDACTESDQCSGGTCQPGVPRDCSDGNPCSVDTCSSPAGCQHAPVQRPGEVLFLMVGNPDKQTVSWSAEPNSGLYDLVRGNLNALPVGPMDDDETCFGDTNGTSALDPQVPLPGRGFWYLVRGVGCDDGPYGEATRGARETATCDDIELVSPVEGEVVNEGALVAARVPAALVPFVEWVHFEYSSNGSLFIPIEGIPPDEAPGYHVLWHARPLPPGNYTVRGLLKLVGRPDPIVFPDATRNVVVNAQPVAQFEIISCQTDPGPPMLGFSALTSSDPDGGIAGYFWDFGDGTTASGPVVTHPYSALGEYSVALTTTDVFGAPTTTFGIVTIDDGNNCDKEPKNSCGCASMDIKTDGAIDGPAGYEWKEGSSGIPAAEKGKLGPYNDGVAGALPAQLDMTKDSFVVKFRFEVVATLKEKSKPQLCTEGQRIKRRTESGGAAGGPRDQTPKNGNRSSDPRYDSSADADDPYVGDPPDDPTMTETADCPPGGAAWCDDDYHGGGGASGAGTGDDDPPNGYKKYDGQVKILWLDAPGFRPITKKTIKVNGAAYHANFEAKVAGPLGTCTCTFDVNIVIDNTGKVTTNELVNESCASSFAAPAGLIASDEVAGDVGNVRQVLDLRVAADETNAETGNMRFEYSLADAADVRIVIADDAQRIIRTLTGGEQTAGTHAAVWDRRDDAGAVVPKGSYRYIVRIGTWEHEGRLDIVDGK